MERSGNGQFAKGNAGGPGRPRRAVEREYLAALGEAVTPDDWRKIVARAKDDALQGDAKARDWLAKYLLGSAPPTLLRVAAEERLGHSADDDVESEAGRLAEKHTLEQVLSGFSLDDEAEGEPL